MSAQAQLLGRGGALGGSLGGSVVPFLLGFVLVNQGVPAAALAIAVIALIGFAMQLALRAGLTRRAAAVARTESRVI